MALLDSIRNLGPVSRQWLNKIDIHSIHDLRRVGSVTAYAMVRRNERRASLNLLWALEAAIRDIDWRELNPSDKELLRAEVAKLQENN
jgi:DNA transformation protein and related proteins